MEHQFIVGDTLGLTNQNTLAAQFLGLGGVDIVADISNFYCTEEDPPTVNTVMYTENNKQLTQE